RNAVREAGPEVEQRERGTARHARIAVGGARAYALEEAGHRAHAGNRVERAHELHLGGARVGEAHVDARGDRRADQALGAIHVVRRAAGAPARRGRRCRSRTDTRPRTRDARTRRTPARPGPGPRTRASRTTGRRSPRRTCARAGRRRSARPPDTPRGTPHNPVGTAWTRCAPRSARAARGRRGSRLWSPTLRGIRRPVRRWSS